jgi:uncharacterized Fe-S cluster protein YjdI
MQPELQAHIAFHLTGRMAKGEVAALAGNDLQPALLAGYRNLAALRYDYPLVLVRDDKQPVQSLTSVIDEAVKIAGAKGDIDRLRKHAFCIEREIRKIAVEGSLGTFKTVWDAAVKRVAIDEPMDSAKRLRAAIKVDGDVVDCDQTTPVAAVRHAWQVGQDRKAKAFRAELTKLIAKLSDILNAEFVRSKEGQSAERLRASVGNVHQNTFNFNVLSKMLNDSAHDVPMPESRRQRVRGLLSVLRAQRFYAVAGEANKEIGVETFSYAFDKCSNAVAAYRERLPKMVEFAKAIAIARLETIGEYSETRHDAFFAEFGANGLDAGELALFPDYLICARAADLSAQDSELVLQAFAAGMPVKLLVQTDDLLEQSAISNDLIVSGVRNRQLTSAAIASGTTYVLQASASGLYRLREALARGLSFSGPALFSVFSGANGVGLPAYLTAAAAAESRAFPAFIYDPSAGADWATRFSLAGNSQLEFDWPAQRFEYEDADQQLNTENLAFSVVEFVALDPRANKYFAKVPREKWSADLVPVSEFLARREKDLTDKVPCMLMVDRDNRLQKVIVNDKLVREARRCAEAWRSLQELGGVHNSHAAAAIERERKVLAEQAREATAAAPVAAAPVAAAQAAPAAPAAAVPAAAAPAAVETAPEKVSDDPYIETPRCSTCNECIQINDKMFGYDGNKQASIINPDAGTYAQLVEAAESCQVSIIHPGKPRNPKEPGLDELLKRAEPFL